MEHLISMEWTDSNVISISYTFKYSGLHSNGMNVRLSEKKYCFWVL